MFRKGDDLSQELLVEHLTIAGYLRQEPVGGPGEFSVRGGIVDVFSPLMRAPVRMEFFGDTVDSIREFDLDDQRSRGPVQHIDILPMQDVLVSREMIRAMGRKARSTGTDDVFQKDLAREARLCRERRIVSRARRSCCLWHFPWSRRSSITRKPPFSFSMNRKFSGKHTRSFMENLQQRFEQTASAGASLCRRRVLFWTPEELGRSRLQNPRLHLEELGDGRISERRVLSRAFTAQRSLARPDQGTGGGGSQEFCERHSGRASRQHARHGGAPARFPS